MMRLFHVNVSVNGAHLSHSVRGEHALRLVVRPVDQGVLAVGEEDGGEVMLGREDGGAVVEHAVAVPLGDTRSATT